jgi:hypothetical protein
VSDFDDASPANDDRQLDAGIKKKSAEQKRSENDGLAAGAFAITYHDIGLAIPVACP